MVSVAGGQLLAVGLRLLPRMTCLALSSPLPPFPTLTSISYRCWHWSGVVEGAAFGRRHWRAMRCGARGAWDVMRAQLQEQHPDVRALALPLKYALFSKYAHTWGVAWDAGRGGRGMRCGRRYESSVRTSLAGASPSDTIRVCLVAPMPSSLAPGMQVQGVWFPVWLKTVGIYPVPFRPDFYI